MIARLVRRVLLVAALTVALGAASYGALALGMRRADRNDSLAAGALRVLDATRGVGAVMHVDGRTLVASCRLLHVGTAVVDLDDGTRLLLSRTHVVRVRANTSDRELLAPDPVDLAAEEANLVGSHDLYSRELTATLLGGSVAVRPTRFGGQPAYALRLGRGAPLVELFVDRASLRPLGARYASRTSTGTSRIVTEPSPRRRRSTGC